MINYVWERALQVVRQSELVGGKFSAMTDVLENIVSVLWMKDPAELQGKSVEEALAGSVQEGLVKAKKDRPDLQID
ncbi:MAG: hypothetical protein LBF65_00430 [Holosporales bacterium]|nr:hypothetical protein [Holosporales bacterium]